MIKLTFNSGISPTHICWVPQRRFSPRWTLICVRVLLPCISNTVKHLVLTNLFLFAQFKATKNLYPSILEFKNKRVLQISMINIFFFLHVIGNLTGIWETYSNSCYYFMILWRNRYWKKNSSLTSLTSERNTNSESEGDKHLHHTLSDRSRCHERIGQPTVWLFLWAEWSWKDTTGQE